MSCTYKKMVICSDVKQKAVERCKNMPVYEYSHRELDANIVGVLGEIAFERFLSHFGIPFEDMRHDTQLDYLVNGKHSVDVKTKDRTVKPRIHYDNSVPTYNHDHQRPNYYYFVSLHRDTSLGHKVFVDNFTTAYMVGGIDIETLDSQGTTWGKGDVDPANGTMFWTECINVTMEQLTPNKDMLSILGKS